MAKIVALLRGINVGGKHTVPMRELAALFEQAGCRDVVTYIQSGNVVCDAGGNKNIGALIEASLAKKFGFTVPVVTRTAAELEKVLASHPFLKHGEDALHVSFLSARPSAAAIGKLEPARFLPDAFAIKGSDIFLHLPNGAGRSKLTNAYFDGKLGVTSTMRNWRTVQKLAALAR